ncbi:MAG: MBL fold metallo-hydrolase [Nitrospira sp.]|nr:MBL fold metallo-hydrolase [Nitrospira sp.]
MKLPLLPLGQCGFRFEFKKVTVYTDPYLSDYVAEVEGQDMRRLKPILIDPSRVADADYVLITHAHMDHCDLKTLVPLAAASPTCQFICPNEVSKLLVIGGISRHRIILAEDEWINLGPGVRVMPVPAAHPHVERDEEGYLRCVGYVIEWEGHKLYHGGDGSPDDCVIERLRQLGPIDVAFIPVNERNFYRERRGIIGNMTVREAFQMAADIGTKVLVPTHWDMFAPNSVYEEEIRLLYKLIQPPFALQINPQEIQF